MSDKELAWKQALKRAALPGSAEVALRFTQPEPNALNYALTCTNAASHKIPDDRDYDILKSVMIPLETLCEDEKPPFSAKLNLALDAITFEK